MSYDPTRDCNQCGKPTKYRILSGFDMVCGKCYSENCDAEEARNSLKTCQWCGKKIPAGCENNADLDIYYCNECFMCYPQEIGQIKDINKKISDKEVGNVDKTTGVYHICADCKGIFKDNYTVNKNLDRVCEACAEKSKNDTCKVPKGKLHLNDLVEIVEMVEHDSKRKTDAVQPKGLNEWRDAVHSLAKEKGWYDTNRQMPELLVLIISELTEALEDYRDGKQPTEIDYDCKAGHCEGNECKRCHINCDDCKHGKPVGIPTEFADAIIRILDACGHYGIDIEKAVEIKHKYNTNRPYRHGKKVC